MAIDLTKINAGVAAIEARNGTLRDENAGLKAQVADLTAKLTAVPATDPADQAAVDAVGDKLATDAAQ